MPIVCYAHAQAPTVATCSDCTRGLCTFCDNLVQPPLCAECLEQRASTLHSRIGRRAAYAALLALVTAGFVGIAGRLVAHPGVWPSIAASYLAVSAFYGADTVRRYIPPMLALLPFVGWGLHQLVWWTASALVGAFTLPFLATKAMVEAQRIKRLSAMVQNRLRPPTPARILSVRME